jgi:hypothetical protein
MLTTSVIGLPVCAQPCAAAYVVGEILDLVQHSMHVADYILTVHHQRFAARHTQRRVQHGALFGKIDFLASEHGVAQALYAAFTCQVEQQFYRAAIEAVLRIVEEQAGRIHSQFGEALGVIGKQLAHLPVAGIRSVAGKG